MRRTYSSEDLCKACVRLGWKFERQSSSHMVFVKPGEPRPIIIQAGKKAVAPFIVSKIVNQLGIRKADLPNYL